MMDLNRAIVEEVVRNRRQEVLPDTNSITHYASPYYDPDKAKEYYERTKELKGRTSGLSTTQREAYTVSKSNISTAKKTESDKAREDQKARLEAIRSKADSARQAIEDKLTKLAADLNAAAEAEKADPLKVIPASASPKIREYLEKQNAKIRDTNAKNARVQMQTAKKDAAAERKAIGDSMRGELQKARDDYKAGMDAMKTKYETASNTELENIRTQL